MKQGFFIFSGPIIASFPSGTTIYKTLFFSPQSYKLKYLLGSVLELKYLQRERKETNFLKQVLKGASGATCKCHFM